MRSAPEKTGVRTWRARAGPRMQIAPEKVKIPDFAPTVAPAVPSRGQDTSGNKAPKYKLLLFNDNVNLREFVARVLVTSIPDYSQSDAYMVMQQAHKFGMAVVGIWEKGTCESYCAQLKSGGLSAPERASALPTRTLPLCSASLEAPPLLAPGVPPPASAPHPPQFRPSRRQMTTERAALVLCAWCMGSEGDIVRDVCEM